jgi:ABC-type uncharacterized transport system substrate-binding protein
MLTIDLYDFFLTFSYEDQSNVIKFPMKILQPEVHVVDRTPDRKCTQEDNSSKLSETCKGYRRDTINA